MDTSVHRPSLMLSYVENMTKYIKTYYKDVPEEKITSFVKNYVEQNIQRPKAKVISYPTYGNIELVTKDLLSFIKETSNKIITPSGTVYQTTDKSKPPIKAFLDSLVKQRNKAKKEMFQYIVQGTMALATLKNFEQSLCKIKQNSVIGSMGTVYSAMYDLESFNAVTSLARHGIIMAYAFSERFLTNNHYFPNLERVLNYIIVLANNAPDEKTVMDVVNKYNLYIPLASDITASLEDSIRKYEPRFSAGWKITDLLSGLKEHQRIYVYYSRNLYNLITDNEHFFRQWINDFINTDKQVVVTEDTNPNDIFKVDEDLLCALTTIYDKYLDGISISKTPEEKPEIAKLLVKSAEKMQEKLDEISDLMNLFLHGKEFIPAIPENRNIKRKCVAISDTDSVIFTDKHLITWYLNGDLKICQDGFNMHALVTYWMTKSMDSLIRTMTKSRGAIGENIYKIKMKNEFLYTVLIKTNLGKHYTGLIKIKEGRVLPKPDLDVKGVSFKTSNLPKITHDFTESVITTIISDMHKYGNLYAGDFIQMGLEYERKISQSIDDGDLTYFGNVSIKPKEEYEKPNSSIHFNYEFWQYVFAEKYGDINIPGKYTLVPCIPTVASSQKYIEWLRARETSIAEKLEKWLSKPEYAKKKITRIPISATCTRIPEVIIPLIDKRRIVYANMAPCQLTLRSLTIDLGDQKKRPLFTDIYSTAQI